MFEHTTPLQTESVDMFAFLIFGRHRKSLFSDFTCGFMRAERFGVLVCNYKMGGERLCPRCNASSCMSALCKNSSSALMRMTLMNKATVPVACHKPWRNRLVAATFYASRMSLSSALIQHASQGLRVQQMPSMRSQMVAPQEKVTTKKSVVPGLLGYLPKCPTSNCRAHFGKLQVTCSTALGMAVKNDKNKEIGQRIMTLDVYQLPVHIFT